MNKNPQEVNSAPIASTSDGVPRSNAMTADQWLERLLYSGKITQVAQHLALVIFTLALRQQKNGIKASVSDLEKITGWKRTAIRDHLAELEAFVHIEKAKGRVKSFFELQGAIEEAIGTALVSAITIRQADNSGAEMGRVAEGRQTEGRETVNSSAEMGRETAKSANIPPADGSPDGHKAEMGRQTVNSSGEMGREADTGKRKFPPIPPFKENNKQTHTDGASASVPVCPAGPGFKQLGHGAWLNGEKIWHPNFNISFPAVEMQLALSVDTQVLDCATVCKSAALQWAAAIEGGQKPSDVLPQNIVGAIVGGARRGVYSGLEHKARMAASKPKSFKPSRW